MSLVGLVFGSWLAPLLKAIFTIPALFALAYGDLPFWADFLLSAYVVALVVAAPIVAKIVLDLPEAAVGIMTWMWLLVSFVIYSMKILFEWASVVGLVIVIAMLVVGFLFSLWAVCKARRRGTDPWQIGWTGMAVSIAGIVLALSGYTVTDAVMLLPL